MTKAFDSATMDAKEPCGEEIEIHVEQEEFEIAYDPDEPDEGVFYKLESGELFYATVRDTVSKI